VVVLALVGAYLYGQLSNELRLPPNTLVRKIFAWGRHNTAARHVWFFISRNVTHRNPGADDPIWHLAQDLPGTGGLAGDQEEAIARLRALGYLAGYEPAPELENVTTYVPGLAYEGLNLYTSGHAPEAVLMDMNGKVLHRWAYEFRDALPDHPEPEGSFRLETWPRVHLYDNGDLLANFDGYALIKVDRDSNLIWAKAGGFHHDIHVEDDGTIYVLTEEIKIIPRIHAYEPCVEDFITLLDPDGNIIRSTSILEAFENSSYASFLDNMGNYGDVLHTNTIEVLDGTHAGRAPFFKKGNVLISVRTLNVIAIVDLELEKVVWALSGQWIGQHEPTLLADGHMLLFDNLGHQRASKVIEIDPFTQEIVWAYEGTPENGFYSPSSGRNQRLPNGNTIINEATGGRVFEVTPDRKIVWEFYNPARAGEDKELIATLFHFWRYGPEQFADWL
jgi:hypothetical protein